MKHPTNDEWIEYVYGETANSSDATAMTQHLRECAECSAQLRAWKKTGAQLNAWELPPSRRSYSTLPRYASGWAAAAAIVFLAFVAGRISAPQTDLPALKQAVQKEVKAELLAEIQKAQEPRDQAIRQTLAALQQQHINDYAALRSDLETVAVLAEQKLQRTEQNLGQLAAFTRTSFNRQQNPNQ